MWASAGADQAEILKSSERTKWATLGPGEPGPLRCEGPWGQSATTTTTTAMLTTTATSVGSSTGTLIVTLIATLIVTTSCPSIATTRAMIMRMATAATSLAAGRSRLRWG